MTHEEPASEVTGPPILLAQSGSFVSSGGGMTSSSEGMIAVVIAVIFGAFFGLMGGFIISHLSRFLSFLTGRNLWGTRWVLIGAIVGGLVFGIKAWIDSRD